MSDNTTPASSDQWLQYYQPPISNTAVPPGGLSDATVVTTTFTSDNMSNPSTSITGGGDLSPVASIGKPARRRSRASRRTPATLLNASATNFRALVQQFTGRQSAISPSGALRGPLNLNFGASSEQNDNDTTSMKATFGFNHYGQPNPWHEQQPQQQLYLDHQYMFSSGSSTSEVFLSTLRNPRPSIFSSQDNVVENNPSHEFTGVSSFDGARNDDHPFRGY